MNRVYQLMSEQAQFWSDSWEPGPSSRKGLFGNSEGVFNPRRPVKDQTLPLPPAPGPDLKGRAADGGWRSDNARRLQLAADALADNDELLGLLEENLPRVEFNRYNLEVYLSIAQLYRQNLEMLFGVDRMNSLVESAQRAAAQGKAKDAAGISGQRAGNRGKNPTAAQHGPPRRGGDMVQELVAAGAKKPTAGDSCMNSTT